MAALRYGLSSSRGGDPIRANSRVLRNPDFFDYAGYIEELELPIKLNARQPCRPHAVADRRIA